jgi:hypothetical protein
VALAVLDEVLGAVRGIGPACATFRSRHRITKAASQGDRVEAVSVRSAESGRDVVLRAPWFVDATEMGDVLPLAGVEYVTGAEARADTGEPHAKPKAEPANMQAFTCCFAAEHIAGEDHTIDRPRDYAFWRDYVPAISPPPAGPVAGHDVFPATLQPFNYGFDPVKAAGLFKYRRILDHALFEPGTYRGDSHARELAAERLPARQSHRCVREAEAARHLEGGKQLSLSLLDWLQTACPRPDGGTGWKGLRLRPDIVGTEDGLANIPTSAKAAVSARSSP